MIVISRGYQKLGENVTKEKRDMHEAINVSFCLSCLCIFLVIF
jgi:hypothetical protein